MLGLRLLTAAIGIPLLVLVMWAGQPWLAVLIGVIVLLAAVETGDLLFGVAAVVLAAAWPQAPAWLTAGWLALLVTASLGVAVRAADGGAAVRMLAGTLTGATYVAMLAFLLLISVSVGPAAASGPLVEWLDAGRAWLLVVVLGVWAYDTAAYAVGRLWGRGRFFNHISPNKTWTGAIGGSVAAVAAGALLGGVMGHAAEGAGLGLLISFAAPLGDLAESALKRAAGVKDSGRLFPGHGGMLDRVDAFVVVAPLAWLYLMAVGLG
jgi:phosphatidate cytidylyltransferase